MNHFCVIHGWKLSKYIYGFKSSAYAHDICLQPLDNDSTVFFLIEILCKFTGYNYCIILYETIPNSSWMDLLDFKFRNILRWWVLFICIYIYIWFFYYYLYKILIIMYY